MKKLIFASILSLSSTTVFATGNSLEKLRSEIDAVMTKGTLNQLPSTIVRELTGANGCVLRESIDSTDGKPNLFVMASANSPEKSVNFYCSKVVSASYSLEAFEVTCDNTFSTWEDGTTTASSSLRVTRNNEVTEFTLASTTEGNTTQMSCEVEN